MKVQVLKSACVLIEANGVKVLADPWLVDGEYYGSWAHYPPYDFQPREFDDVDFIYISHIHPDHLSRKTLALLRRTIPVLIHAYATPFLKANIESLGYQVVELPHGRRTHLKNDVHINIFAADNCNPALCGKFFGCSPLEKAFGSTQIDSLSVIDDGRHAVMNANDCPFELARETVVAALQSNPGIDLLLTGYSGAGPYPQCFPQLSAAERERAAAAKKSQFLRQAESYIVAVRPRFYVPFAGTYTLAGRLAELNSFRGVPDLSEAHDFLNRPDSPIDRHRSRGCLLASGGKIDLATGTCDSPYAPVVPAEKARYVAEVLAIRALDYEVCPPPAVDELLALIPACYDRMDRKRRQIGFESSTRALVTLGNGECVRMCLDGQGYDVVAEDIARKEDAYVLFRTDPRLLLWLLKGPKYAHWDSAEIGSHVEFERRPERFERALYHVMCFFHA